MCVHLGSHGDGDAAAADPPAFSRGGGEACGQVGAAVVGSDGEGSHCHSHFAAGVDETVESSHLIRFPSRWRWLAWQAERVRGPKVVRARDHGSAHSSPLWVHGPDTFMGNGLPNSQGSHRLTTTERKSHRRSPFPSGRPSPSHRRRGGEEEKQSQQRRWA